MPQYSYCRSQTRMEEICCGMGIHMKRKISELLMAALIVSSMTVGCGQTGNDHPGGIPAETSEPTEEMLDVPNVDTEMSDQSAEIIIEEEAGPGTLNEEYLTGEWHIDTPGNHGIDGEAITSFFKRIESEPILSVVMIRDGSIVSEYYKSGYDQNSVFTLNSCAKSVTSAVIGMAIDRGIIEGLDAKIADFFPELKDAEEETKQEITVAHLLNMTSGLDWPEWTTWNSGFGDWLESDDWVAFALNREMTDAPGEAFTYNTGGTQLLSAIMNAAAGESAYAFAERNLFRPLGMSSVEWPEDPQGVTCGGFAIRMSARDAARFGQLYVNKGKWGDQQILSESWIDVSTEKQSEGHVWFSDYGYSWWIDSVSAAGSSQRYALHYAMGYGGQYIFVVPELDLVTVITSDWPGNHTSRPLAYFKFTIMPSVEP